MRNNQVDGYDLQVGYSDTAMQFTASMNVSLQSCKHQHLGNNFDKIAMALYRIYYEITAD